MEQIVLVPAVLPAQALTAVPVDNMKIGVISDTHIPRQAKELPKIIFDHFKGVDLILHAGDLCIPSVLDELRQITPNVEAVIGNMDDRTVTLPMKRLINAGGLKIALIHGWGAPMGMKNRIWNELKDDIPNVIIFGHTHQPEKATMHNVLFLNPGSPTDRMFTSVNSIALLNIEDGKADAQIIML